jgi:hypothetical protein
MPYEYSCVICSKKVSRQNKIKHLFSSSHSQDIWNAILKRKEMFNLWINSLSTKNPLVIPSILFSGSSYKICLACNSLNQSLPTFCGCPCGDMAQNAKLIKDILDTKTFKENPKFQKSVDTEPMNIACQTEEDSNTLKKENAKLKTQIHNLEIDAKIIEASESNSDALNHILSHLQETNLEEMLKLMREIKQYFPVAYENQKKQFGSEWDESLMEETAELPYLFPTID